MPDVARTVVAPVPGTGAVRDACPSGHRPFEAADGLLMRVRVPGGTLTGEQVEAVAVAAGRHGSGVVEVTRRANLQLRGIRADALAAAQAELVAAGLLPADPDDDERRNVLAAPAAGLDPTEVADVRPFVRDLLDRLASGAVPQALHPKAGVLLDGGGAVSVRGIRQDVALGAVRRRDTGDVEAELALGRPLPLAPDPSTPTLTVPLGTVPDVAAVALSLTAPDPHHADAGHRIHELVDGWGLDAVVAEVERRAGVTVSRSAAGLLDRAEPVPAAPLGLHRARRDGTVLVGAAPVLGRIDAASLAMLGAASCRQGDGTIRLTPWRSVLVPGVPADRAPALLAELARLGLIIDPADPATSVVACVGATGCEAGHTDALGDARRLIDARRRTADVPHPSVHVSGCGKRCASRQVHDVTLVGVAPARYDVLVRGPGRGDERPARRSVPFAEAVRGA